MAQLRNATGTTGLFTDGDWILSDNMDKAGTIGVIQLKHVGVGEFLPKDFQFISEKTFRDLGCTEVLPGDVLISRMADPIARACIVPRLPFRLVTAVDVSILRVDEQTADPLFISHLCNSPVVRNQAETASRGTTRSRITRTELEELEVPLPELSEQKRIARLLGQADRLRRTRRYAVELSETFLPAAFLELFGRTPAYEQYTAEDLLDEGTILEIEDGNHGDGYPRAFEFSNEGIPFLTATNVSENGVRLYEAPRLPEQRARSLRIGWIKPNDVLLSHNATIGRVGVVPNFQGEAVVGTSLTFYRLNMERFDPNFFAGMLRSEFYQKQLASLMKQTTRNQVPVTRQLTLRLFLPPIREQQQFAALVRRQERLRARQREALRQAEHLFQSLLHQAFTVRV